MESARGGEALVVSRDGLVRGLLGMMLAEEGWRPAAFREPEVAFRYFCGRFAWTALVVVDARPDADGAGRLLRCVAVLRPDLRPTLLVGAREGSDLERWVEARGGAVEIICDGSGPVRALRPTPERRTAATS